MFNEQSRQAKIETAKASLGRLTDRDDVLAVYLAGSLTAGLGTSTSDVDVFAVTTDEGRKMRPDQYYEGGEWLDEELRTLDDINNLVAQFEEFVARKTEDSQIFVAGELLDDAIRLMWSVDVKSHPAVTEARRRLHENVDVVRRVVVAWHVTRGFGMFEDLRGAVLDQDADAAELISNRLLVECLQTYQGGCGDLYIGDKFTWAKLHRSAGTSFPFETLRELMRSVPPDGPAFWDFVKRRTRFAQTCVVAAIVDGWDTANAAEWPVWSCGDTYLHRSEVVYPYRLADGAFFDDLQGHQFAVPVPVLRLWGLADGGTPRAQIVDRMCEYVERAGHDAVPGEVEKSLDDMLDRGFLLPGTAEGGG